MRLHQLVPMFDRQSWIFGRFFECIQTILSRIDLIDENFRSICKSQGVIGVDFGGSIERGFSIQIIPHFAERPTANRMGNGIIPV